MLSITTDSAFSFNTTVRLRPAALAYPRDAREVVAAVRYARDHGLRVAPSAPATAAASGTAPPS